VKHVVEEVILIMIIAALDYFSGYKVYSK